MMDTHHGHSHGTHTHGHDSVSNIRLAFFLNLIFALIEIVGGLLTNSVAILTDAIHDLGDCLSLGLAWYFEILSKKQHNASYTFGYRRYSLVGAVLNSLILVGGSLYMLTHSIPRLFEPEEADADGMLILAGLGIVVHGIAVMRLSKGKSINEKVVSLHHMEDVLGWVAVLIVGVVLQFWHLPILDPILSIAITIYIIYNVFKNIKFSLNIILQRTPDDVNPETIKQQVEQLNSVKEVYDIHTWTMDGQYHVLTMHVVADDIDTLEKTKALKSKIRAVLSDLKISHSTIEIDNEQIHLDPH